MTPAFWSGKRVFLTGHTGFKGSWLTMWLASAGATVRGYALTPPTNPSLFDLAKVAELCDHHVGDVRDAAALTRALTEFRPDIVIHMAAQPLVRLSYDQPVETYSTNVMGTVNLFEAARRAPSVRAIVNVTTDKCYENREWVWGYRENDPMGGFDPYSSSKGCAELVTSAYARSYFSKADGPTLGSGRAGNVIGGGDWAIDRIVPDCIRALQQKQRIPIRNPQATRPWQHVLEPLSGYLWLATLLAKPKLAQCPLENLTAPFNFGPGLEANRTVAELAAEILKHWPGKTEDRHNPKAAHEAGLLQLSTDKAHALLRWSPVWKFAENVEHTVNWYRQTQRKSAAAAQQLTAAQIAQYVARAKQLALPWAAATPSR